ncbi:MAG: hypothetical protein GVY34_10600 [Alphaproteobacteria bacterium]|jgi:hypothetical protein|nr:hypothetical protein [Alphaproteobacteria bacterium]
MVDKHSLHSSTREEYIEYILLAKICAFGWEQDRFVEVARTQTDAQGYDLVLACDGVMRHVQLKASKHGARARSQKINTALASKPGGCVIWAEVAPDSLEPMKYLWFGGQPGEPLPDPGDKRARHVKGNAQGEKGIRDAIRVVAKSRFTPLTTTHDLFMRLFGDVQASES